MGDLLSDDLLQSKQAASNTLANAAPVLLSLLRALRYYFQLVCCSKITPHAGELHNGMIHGNIGLSYKAERDMQLTCMVSNVLQLLHQNSRACRPAPQSRIAETEKANSTAGQISINRGHHRTHVTMADDLVLVPVQLQAFILNPEVCNTGKTDDHGARIIPITQPNYTFLRLDNFLIQSDVLNHVDLHNAAPAANNSRMTDLGARPEATPRRHREGVYLHWILPQAYRSGVTSADSVSAGRHEQERLRRGLAPRKDDNLDSAKTNTDTPEFLQPPTRWIVLRKLDLDTISPAEAQPHFKEYQAWVVESDYQWSLDNIPTDYDLQVDVSPFVVGVAGETVDIEQQAEVFIGRKTPLEKWKRDPCAEYANISLLRSSNQLFADFQLHNTNVFSILDNFEYFDKSKPNEAQFLNQATASYYLVGWHSDGSTDPLWDETGTFTHAQKLEGLYMSLQEGGHKIIMNTWMDSKEPTRMCLHGALYDVAWNRHSKPNKVPADKYAQSLQMPDVPAVSVGTTPMDALLTYCSSRKDHEDDAVIKQLEEDILAIDSLLHARDDGVEGQREAKDTVYNWNFNRSQGGTHYFVAGEDSKGRPTEPDPKSIAALRTLNEFQLLLDACRRSAQQYRWDIFSCWWKYVTDVTNKTDSSLNSSFKHQVEDLSTRLGQLQEHILTLETKVAKMLEEGASEGSLADAKTGTLPFYYQARDPTVLVGGIAPGWPSDFNDNVSVRLPIQTITSSESLPQGLNELVQLIAKVFPEANPLGQMSRLYGEFWALLSRKDPGQQPSDGQAYPQFHDQESEYEGTLLWRDRWESVQAWFPLYAEWEVEYTHIPFEFWSLDEQAARLSEGKTIRYGVSADDGKPLWEKMQKSSKDVRILSGRSLILPQPSFSLAAKVKQLFADTPPTILENYLREKDRNELLANIGKLSYLSCPLTGLTDGLLTVARGSHIKPENKYIKLDGEVTTSAVKAAEYSEAGLTKANIELISNNSALTPYATMSDFSNALFCPFKPATHGQIRFRKFNIIDKFGQALVAIDPRPRVSGPPPLYPCISDFYEPQVVNLDDGTTQANTVVQNSGSNCEFIQLPPQINQNARLNADFVIRASIDSSDDPSGHPKNKVSDSAYWRPVNEWENPIWGWVVTNYADYGIQLFLPDGTFYREVRFGGPEGVEVEPKWLPFAPDPKLPQTGNTAQLDALVERLGNKEYLGGFWNMIVTALDNMTPPPNSYAQFLGSIVGRPLALANMGWSLELDGPPLKNQSTKTKDAVKDPLIHLLPRESDDQHSYTFQVKLGDRYREYDGLVGYFDSNPHPKPGNNGSDELILDYVNTYFASERKGEHSAEENLRPISTNNYPKFKPFWVPPFPEEPPYNDKKAPPIAPDDYTDRRNRQMHVFGAILDPFTPVHAYSSVLPARALQLAPWTWQDAMQNMTAFFHAGPLTVMAELGEYDASHPLTTSSVKDTPARNVALPSLPAGDWSWLQPFVDPVPIHDLPVFNAYGIEKKGNILSPGFQKGPYTATEGFLQLRRPIMVEKPDTEKS
ncbi:hypothetical protein G7046_g4214 [Stylonectria norvegica]|nr:hypothetical protein G7046_g4214 [Stylonectria norvegica]